MIGKDSKTVVLRNRARYSTCNTPQKNAAQLPFSQIKLSQRPVSPDREKSIARLGYLTRWQLAYQ